MKKFIGDLQSKTSAELMKQATKLREEIAAARITMSANPPKDTNITMKKRRELSQVLTVLTEKTK